MLTPNQISKLDRLGAKARCFVQVGSQEVVKFDVATNAPKLIQAERPERTGCDIIDITTGEKYATAYGLDQLEAVDNALALAEKSPKPLTRAQKLDRDKFAAKENELLAENERLKKELEEARAASPSTARRKPALSPAE